MTDRTTKSGGVNANQAKLVNGEGSTCDIIGCRQNASSWFVSTNLRTKHQLFTRPYIGHFKGPGRSSTAPDDMDVESYLQQGILTNGGPEAGEKLSGIDVTEYSMSYLPDFANPQRAEHIIPPPVAVGGWIRGGAPTRDDIRAIDHKRFIQNQQNSFIINS